mgnify:CR=1 FL=1
MKQKLLKRSKKAALVMMVPTVTILMAGCGEEPVQSAVFETVDQCAAYYNPEQCKADLAQATALHTQVAPKYTSQQACEADFGAGQCETPPATQAQSGGGFFMPMMMGFLMGQMMNGGNKLKQPVQPQPLYKSRDDQGTFRTANNTPVAKSTGSTYLRPSSVQTRPAGLVSRGGFGAQAQQRQSSSSSYGG